MNPVCTRKTLRQGTAMAGAVCVVLFCLLLFSCGGALQIRQEGSGACAVQVLFAAQTSALSDNRETRAAYPSAVSPDIVYTVSAVEKETSNAPVVSNKPPYVLELTPRKTWILTVTGTVTQNGNTYTVLWGTQELVLPPFATSASANVSVSRITGQDWTGATGSMKLRMSWSKAENIFSTEVTSVPLCFNFGALSNTTPLETQALEKNDVPAGDYIIITKLYAKKGGELFLAGTHTETISIWPGLVTDTWYTQNGAVQVLEISNFRRQTEYYVSGDAKDSTRAFLPPGSDTTGHGTLFAPYASVQEAIDQIPRLVNDDAVYTIYIDGTIKRTADMHVGTRAMIDIAPGADEFNVQVVLKGFSPTAVIDVQAGSSDPCRGIYIAGSSVDVTLDYVTVKGAYVADGESGGGIYVSRARLSVQNGAAVSDCRAGKGGGIAIKGGECNLYDGVITRNTARYGGGGIFLDSGTLFNRLLLKKGIITGNISQEGDGGGLLALTGTLTIDDLEACPGGSGAGPMQFEKNIAKGMPNSYHFAASCVLNGTTLTADVQEDHGGR